MGRCSVFELLSYYHLSSAYIYAVSAERERGGSRVGRKCLSILSNSSDAVATSSASKYIGGCHLFNWAQAGLGPAEPRMVNRLSSGDQSGSVKSLTLRFSLKLNTLNLIIAVPI